MNSRGERIEDEHNSRACNHAAACLIYHICSKQVYHPATRLEIISRTSRGVKPAIQHSNANGQLPRRSSCCCADGGLCRSPLCLKAAVDRSDIYAGDRQQLIAGSYPERYHPASASISSGRKCDRAFREHRPVQLSERSRACIRRLLRLFRLSLMASFLRKAADNSHCRLFYSYRSYRAISRLPGSTLG